METPLTVIEGNGPMVEMLTGMLDRARRGELLGVMVVTMDEETIGSAWQIRDDVAHGYARMVLAMERARERLMRGE